MEHAVVEVIKEMPEKDTEESEELFNIFELIAPPTLTENVTSFGMHYNHASLNGWVKQPSPCCGAASVAGALNALLHLSRHDDLAFTHLDVLNIYRRMFYELIVKKVTSFERKLGGAFEPILSEIELELKNEGRFVGGKKATNASKLAVKNAVDRILNRSGEELADSWRLLKELEIVKEEEQQTVAALECTTRNSSTEETLKSDIIVIPKFVKSFRSSFRFDERGEGNTTTSGGVPSQSIGITQQEVAEEDGGSDPDEDAEDDDKIDSRGSGSKQWKWLLDIMVILKNISGYRKLSDPQSPSTAAIGNLGILQGVQLLTEEGNISPLVEASLFMGMKRGSKSKLPIAVSHSDDGKIIQSQWEIFRSAFADSKNVLLFHLRNHYALIFALREYVTAEDLCVREVLTARRGQRPTAWIRFEEMREVVLSWEGYKVIKISLRDAAVRSDLRQCKVDLLRSLSEFIPVKKSFLDPTT